MRTICFLLTLTASTLTVQAQLYIGSDANSLVIKAGETLNYDGLSLTPSADFTLSNTTLTKTDANTISPAPSWTYITRYFSFSNTTPAFTGTLRFSYSGASLNGLTAGNLRIFARNSTSWTGGFGTDVGTGGGSYVEASSLSSTGLNTITLAASGTSLPLTWVSFTATKKENTSVLKWITASEINTQDFVIEHSSNGRDWTIIGRVNAAGNATTRKDYQFTHQTPVPGYNYYRLLQRDLDGRKSYTSVLSVLMGTDDIKLKVFPNPVIYGLVYVMMNQAALVKIFDASGRLVINRWMPSGLQSLDVSRLIAGQYFIQVNSESTSIIIDK